MEPAAYAQFALGATAEASSLGIYRRYDTSTSLAVIQPLGAPQQLPMRYGVLVQIGKSKS
jgi:hypothetical protein